ncbi:hypothetical protein BD311DRAFT_502653 [Dichomitus squalens]|uniref:Uncharacterized protein n=1 Tax=Dichomitus squalens TaxID=114155 RepID=A0A4Q9MFI5_9APHY|nr:hypothetical protein BD311DRAFT_502653 [Dichomitus squalens]
MTAVLSPQRNSSSFVQPPDLTHGAASEALALHADPYRHVHNGTTALLESNSSALSARDPVQISEQVNPEVNSLYAPSQHTSVQASTNLSHADPAFTNASEHGDSGNDQTLHSLETPAPPPLPVKFPIYDRPKSVSILAPADISPVSRGFSYSASDLGHAFRTSRSLDLTSPGSVPAPPTILTSQQHPVHITAGGSDLSFPLDAFHANPSTMEPVTGDTSSKAYRRNKLLKSRPQPPSSLATRPSALSLLLNRAFGSGESLSRHSRSNSAPSMDDRTYRPTRSLSDGSAKSPLARPHPSSRGSDTTDSSCTTLSWASTSVSDASTAITTPESVASPGLSPRNSTRTNKLHKKRPPLAPSAYQYPPGRHSAALGRSKSTPNGLGQRSPKNRIWTSVEEARHAAESVDESGGQEPSYWHASPTESSPSGRSTLGPIFEVRKRRSSQAISDLA